LESGTVELGHGTAGDGLIGEMLQRALRVVWYRWS
jgi:hypothetical protein